MKLYVCYYDRGFGEGYSPPCAVFDTEKKALEWVQKAGIWGEFEELVLNEV